MKISLSWLKEFVDIKLTPRELADLISAKLTEVENIVNQAKKYEGIIAVKIELLEKHPNSDHLWLVTVFDGVEKRRVVCGARNLAVGQLVPLITPGSKVPKTGDIIKESVIRGEKSAGMLASPRELEISDDHSGILILDPSVKPGTPISQVLDFNDVILEIENKALTHRGDCFSHLGIAREVAAITKETFKNPDYKLTPYQNSDNINIEIENSTDCPRYLAAYVTKVKIQPSPAYIQNRLKSCGVRPINNIVDFTNYVMLETGQPLHAFDASKLTFKNGNIALSVRRAKEGEVISTLDGYSRKLGVDNLVITNFDNPVAVAGVMGGTSSEISDTTTEVLIEAANFNHYAIRKSSRVMGLRTEASIRYEKNLDPNLAEQGMATVLQLIKETAGCEEASVTDKYPNPAKPVTISTSVNYINDRLGIEVAQNKILGILKSLGLTTSLVKNNELKVVSPTFRRDITIAEDIIEEVARIYGYEKITSSLPQKSLAPVGLTTSQREEEEVLQLLKELGYNEVYSYSFVGEALYQKAKLSTGKLLEIVNPLSPELKYLRDSLVPQILEKVAFNSHNFNHFKLFERGREIIPARSENKLPEELSKVTTAVYFKDGSDLETLYRQVKGDLEVVLEKFNIGSVEWVEEDRKHYWSALAQILVTDCVLGSLSVVSDTVLNNFGIKGQVILWEIDLTALIKLSSGKFVTIKEIPGYPPIIEDISFYLKPETKVIKTIKEIQEISELIEEITVKDIYKDKDKKSVTIQIIYQDLKRALSDKDVAPIRGRIVKLLSEKHHLQVRSS